LINEVLGSLGAEVFIPSEDISSGNKKEKPALEWANAHPDELPLRPGTELVHELLCRLAGKEGPGAAT